MPRRPPVAPLLLLALAAGCSSEPEPDTGPVPVPTPTSSVAPEAAQACARLLDTLPDEIDPGVTRRATTGDPLSAAWGDPAVVLTCAVPVPDRPEEPAQVNGVLWSVRDIGAGFRWTTTALGVNVAVEIPDAYDNGAELVNPLAQPILATLPAQPSPAPGG